MPNEAAFAELLHRACTEDQHAAAILVAEYEPELRRYVRFRLTDPTLRRFLDSLDICQSVLSNFIVHLQAGTLKEIPAAPRQLACMLAVMAKNKVYDKVRRQQADRRGGGRVDKAERETLEDLADPKHQSPLDHLAGWEIVEAVRDHLPETDRDLLDRWLLGDDWPQIAAYYGEKPDAVRNRLTRAIDRAAKALGLVEEMP